MPLSNGNRTYLTEMMGFYLFRTLIKREKSQSNGRDNSDWLHKPLNKMTERVPADGRKTCNLKSARNYIECAYTTTGLLPSRQTNPASGCVSRKRRNHT